MEGMPNKTITITDTEEALCTATSLKNYATERKPIL